MPKRTFDAKSHIAAFNSWKQAQLLRKEAIKRNTIIEVAKNIGLPKSEQFITELLNSEIFERIGRGLYSFKDKEPVHFSKLSAVYNSYTRKCRPRNKTIELSLEECIKTLKDAGYIILKPVPNVYSVV